LIARKLAGLKLEAGTLSQQNQAEVIPASNGLKLRMGGRLGGIDPAALAKAEAALKGLANNFDNWMQDELVKLDAARERIRLEGHNAETSEALYFRSHDLKGLGSTYGYPIVTRIAASLCRLTDDPATRLKAPLPLIDAHIDGIKTAVRDGVRDVDHATGKSLIDDLEGRVRSFEG
jgi:hypothetical protein